MVRKILIICSLVIFLASFLSPAIAQEKNLIRLGTCASKINPLYYSLKNFAEGIEKRFPGKYKIEIYPDSQLGAEKEMAQGILTGTLHGAVLSWATMNMIGKSPKLAALSTPFLFRSTDAIYGIYKDFLAQETVAPEYERMGFKLMSCTNMGVVALGNNIRAIRKPTDLKGIKIRTWEDKFMLRALRDMGCNPVVMPYSEVLTGLQQKQIDGVITTDMHIIFDGLIDVLKYVSDVRLLYGLHTIAISLDWFNKQPKEVQQALLEIGEEATEFSYKMAQKNAVKVLKDFEKRGAKVERLTPEERQKFVEKCQGVFDMARKIAGEAYVNKILEASKKY